MLRWITKLIKRFGNRAAIFIDDHTSKEYEPAGEVSPKVWPNEPPRCLSEKKRKAWKKHMDRERKKEAAAAKKAAEEATIKRAADVAARKTAEDDVHKNTDVHPEKPYQPKLPANEWNRGGAGNIRIDAEAEMKAEIEAAAKRAAEEAERKAFLDALSRTKEKAKAAVENVFREAMDTGASHKIPIGQDQGLLPKPPEPSHRADGWDKGLLPAEMERGKDLPIETQVSEKDRRPQTSKGDTPADLPIHSVAPSDTVRDKRKTEPLFEYVPPLFSLRHVTKTFGSGRSLVKALDDVTIDIREGEITAFIGPSGKGKTTLLNLLGGLDKPDNGHVLYRGSSMSFGTHEVERFRLECVGWIFQELNLMGHLPAWMNVTLPIVLKGGHWNRRTKKLADALLEDVGLEVSVVSRKYPHQLSGGERQRVAIARCIAKEASVILADEPTGHLDNANSQNVLEILRNYQRSYSASVILVTHNVELAEQYCDTRFVFKDTGKIELIGSRLAA